MTTDEELLEQYARERSESAFGELVTRHLDYVYSDALRVVNGDAPLAQDVTQTVFFDLARQAGKLPCDVALAGWLHRHTCYTAAKAVRSERRRQSREHTAMEMRALDDNTRPEWELVAPYLDESLNELDPKDRDALVLRYLRKQNLRAVGATLSISEDAAQKRVDRALEKLHVLLKQRGATLTVAALGTALATQAVTAAPAGLAASIAKIALAGAAAPSSGTAVALREMLSSKLSLVFGCGAAAIEVIVISLVWHWEGANRTTATVHESVEPASAVSAVQDDATSASDNAVSQTGLTAMTSASGLPLAALAADTNQQVPAAYQETTNLVSIPATVSIAEANSQSPKALEWVWIPPGKFMMGSPDTLAGQRHQGPQTEVTTTYGFWLGKYEVTYAQFREVTARMPDGPTEPDLDLACAFVKWSEAARFCEVLTTREREAGRLPAGYVCRLPTEAEWEYACRAGTVTRFSFGDDEGETLVASFVWCSGYNGIPVQKVGGKKPNPWGLFDMHGNAAEWCLDYLGSYPGGSVTNPVGVIDGDFFVQRGGRSSDHAGLCTSASRRVVRRGDWIMPGGNGFRAAVAPALPSKGL